MKKISLIIAILLISIGSHAQYEYEVDRTAEQLIERLVGPGITILNPVLDCIDLSNSTYQGEGVLFIDTGIILANGNLNNLFVPSTSTGISFGLYGDLGLDEKRDEDLNAIYRSWGTDTLLLSYHTCKLTFDMVPHVDTVKLDFSIKESGMSDSWRILSDQFIRPGCRPTADMFAILVSGGTELYDKKNFGVIPGTDIPVNIFTLQSAIGMEDYKNCRDGGMAGWEGIPFLEYYYHVPTMDGPLDYIKIGGMSTKFEAVIPVTACDTYAVKLAVAKNLFHMEESDFAPGTAPEGLPAIDYRTGASAFFLGNMRGVGAVYEDCTVSDTSSSIPTGVPIAALGIYPNPAQQAITIDIGKSRYQQATVIIYDQLGRQVYVEDLATYQSHIQLSIATLPVGVYQVVLHTDKGYYAGRFVKEK